MYFKFHKYNHAFTFLSPNFVIHNTAFGERTFNYTHKSYLIDHNNSLLLEVLLFINFSLFILKRDSLKAFFLNNLIFLIRFMEASTK